MRETRACLICITHWTLDQVDDVPFPEVSLIIDTYRTMKGGKRRPVRPESPNATDMPARPPDRVIPPLVQVPEQQFDSIQEEQAFAQTMTAEARANSKHISSQPLWVQQSFAMRNRSAVEVFDEIKKTERK